MDINFPDRPGASSSPPAKRILIADDTLSSRELLRSILESSGYEVAEAEDCKQVIDRATTFRPHLVILDLQAPHLNGCAAATALRKIPAFAMMPIVALAATLADAIPEKITQAGFTGYLVKPVGPARLRQCIASLL